MFHLLLCAGLVLTLPLLTSQSCTDGTAQQCLNADVVPGSNLAGEGFDITKLERKGAFVLEMNQWERKDKSCLLCKNPYMGNRWQKLPLAVVDWRAKLACSNKVSSKLHKSSESLVSSSTSTVENNWKVNLDFQGVTKSASFMLAGTHSKLAAYSMDKSKNDKFSFSSQSMSCQFYSYRVTNTPRLHKEFHEAVRNLPTTYCHDTKTQFYKFIDNFGTHYITKVKLGGSIESVTSVRQCQASLQGLSVEEVQLCLEAEASATIKVSIQAETKHCQKDSDKMESKKSFSDSFSERFTETKGGHTTETNLLFSANKNPSAYKEWLDSVPQNPDIISYSLDSLHELVPVNNPVHKNLRSAISHYILEKGLWRNCSNGCRAGVRSNTRDSCVCECHNEGPVNQDCCPTRKGIARVIITVQRASKLWGDYHSATDGYVKVSFGGQKLYQTPVILNNNNPHWGAVLDLGPQDLSSANNVVFEVWDQDNNWDDDQLGVCKTVVTAGTREDLCALNHGRLFYKLEAKCAPSLGGQLCTDYKRSPMSQSLVKLYSSRHARPIPKAELRKMGVFWNESENSLNEQTLPQYLEKLAPGLQKVYE